MLAKWWQSSVFIVLASFVAACSNTPTSTTPKLEEYWYVRQVKLTPYAAGSSKNLQATLFIECPYNPAVQVGLLLEDSSINAIPVARSNKTPTGQSILGVVFLHLDPDSRATKNFGAVGYPQEENRNFHKLLFHSGTRPRFDKLVDEHYYLAPDFVKTLEEPGTLAMTVVGVESRTSPPSPKRVEFMIPLCGSVKVLQQAEAGCSRSPVE